MILAQLFSYLLWPIAAIGIVGIGLICAYWASVGKRVNDLWVKCASKVIKLLSLLPSIYGAYASAGKDAWFFPALAGGINIVVWEVLETLIDNRVKAANVLARGSLERAEQEGALRTKLLSAFRVAVDHKTKRIRRETPDAGRKLRLDQVRVALTPRPHLQELLNALAVFFQEQQPPANNRSPNIRIGVYVNMDGVMTPIHGVSLNDIDYNPFSSYKQHQAAFQINTTGKPSLVVSAVKEKQLLVAEDCVAAAAKGTFSFFHDDQRRYLRSMVAYYLGKVPLENGKMTDGVLAIDTDVPGFFKEADDASLRFFLREFAARIRLELSLIALLTVRHQQL